MWLCRTCRRVSVQIVFKSSKSFHRKTHVLAITPRRATPSLISHLNCGKLSKVNAGEVAERLKAAVC
jgi:hypothetical protein